MYRRQKDVIKIEKFYLFIRVSPFNSLYIRLKDIMYCHTTSSPILFKYYRYILKPQVVGYEPENYLPWTPGRTGKMFFRASLCSTEALSSIYVIEVQFPSYIMPGVV